MDAELLTIAGLVAAVLEQLRIEYALGGAVAGSILGEPRATNDLDLVADIREADVDTLLDALETAGFYVPRAAARDAVESRRSFNIVHHTTAMKVDIFVAGRTPLDLEELRRRQLITISQTPRRQLYLATAEDLMLQKLLWFKDGGGTSDRQWRDVLGLIKVQDERLDRRYLSQWARRLGVDDLLSLAMTQAGQTFS